MSPAGLSSAALDRMHDALAGFVKQGAVPGLVAVVEHGEAVHADVIGTMEPKGRAPVRRDTIFRISSMTKPVTAAATMLLVDEGTLRLDEPVERLLPELANRRVLKRVDGPLEDTMPARRAIAVRDLLTFTLGFGLLFADPTQVPILKAMNDLQLGMGPPMPATMPPPDEWMRRLGTLPLMHQPGERWMYNTGADVLTVLVARASGRPFEAFLRERLFEPLGMKDTAFHVPPEKLNRFGPLHWTDYRTGQDGVFDPGPDGQWGRPPAFPSGAGGLASTADDYLAFARMMMNGGESWAARILSKQSVEAMTRDQLTPEQKADELIPGYWDSHGWGFGMAVLTKPDGLVSAPGRYGWDGGMGTSWFNDPKAGLTTILMTNRMWSSPDPPPLFREFWKSAYAALKD